MLFFIYILIAVLFTIFVIWELFTETDWKKQIGLAIILVPFILRILLIK